MAAIGNGIDRGLRGRIDGLATRMDAAEARLDVLDPPADTTPPTIAARTPAAGATDVAIGATLSVTFSEDVDAATVTGATFTLADAGGNPVAATVSYDAATRTATLQPSAALADGASYTLTVRGGAGGVADLAGNVLAADASWTFATAPAYVPPASGDGPFLLATPGQQSAWADMAATNDPWLNFVKATAPTEDNNWGYSGQWNAAAWRMTGDTAYVEAAWALLDPRINGANGGMRVADNWSREYFIEHVIMYDWLRDGLSADRRTAYIGWLNRFADTVSQNLPVGGVDPGYGFRFSDTDELIGNLLAVYLVDALPDNPRKGDWTQTGATAVVSGRGNLPMGGLDLSAGFDPAKGLAQDTVRDNLEMVFRFAKGGVIPESGEYDQGTVRLWIMGLEALRDAYAGVDHFPTGTQVILDACEYEFARLAPDLSGFYQWGDEENPRNRRLTEYAATLAMLAGLAARHGLARAPQFHGRFQALISPGSFMWSRAFYFYWPQLPTAAFTPAPFYAEGQHLLIHAAGSSLFAAQHHPNYGVDHTITKWADCCLYGPYNGAGGWLLDRPLGYGGHVGGPAGANGLIVAGFLARMAERAEVTHHATGPDTAYIASSTGGQYRLSGYAPPPTFLNDWSRRLLWVAPDLVVVWDSVDAVDPATQGYDLSQSWEAGEVTAIQTAPALKQCVFHAPATPTQAGSRLSWSARNGAPARLDMILPATRTVAIVDDNTTFPGELQAGEYGVQARIMPPAGQQLDVFLNVLTFGDDDATCTPVGDSGVLVARAGRESVFAWFGTAAPPDPGTPARTFWCQAGSLTDTPAA